jgi:cobalt-zinc-cadmium efflux system outer membrane protein
MFRFIAARRLAFAALLTAGLSGVASADEPLTLREALARTLQSNPDLAAYQYVLKAQDGRVMQAGLRPNPTLSADVENVFGSGDAQGFDAAELTLGLSQLIELNGLRGKRVSLARLEREGLEAEGDIARLDLVAETARRFVSLVSQQEKHRLTHLAVELAENTAAAVNRRVQAAAAPDAERDRAAVAVERARIADAHAEHELLAARSDLAAAWGAAEPDFTDAAADLYQLPQIAEYPELDAALQRAPDIARYLSETRLRESEITLALASRSPGFEVGAGVRRFEETRDTAWVFSIGLPLPISDRQQGNIAAARALKDGAEAQRGASLVKARAQLFRNYRELLDQRQQVAALRERALPRMEAAFRNTQYAYDRGRYSYLELVDAQRELLEVRDGLIDAATAYHLTLIEIERLTGTAVSR